MFIYLIRTDSTVPSYGWVIFHFLFFSFSLFLVTFCLEESKQFFFFFLLVERWAVAIGFIQQINNSNDNMNWSLTMSGVVLNTLYALSHLLSTYYLPDTRKAKLNAILQFLTMSLWCPGGDKHSDRYCPHSVPHAWGCLQATVGGWRMSVHSSSEKKGLRLREGVRWNER